MNEFLYNNFDITTYIQVNLATLRFECLVTSLFGCYMHDRTKEGVQT